MEVPAVAGHGGRLWPAPLHADLNVTNSCNLSCRHCHSSSGARFDGELKTDELLSVVTDLHDLGVLRLAIAGGEPFSRRDIVDILEHACSLPGWSVSVITNGTGLSHDRVDELTRRCPELGVNISLDGSTADRFSILRRTKSGRSSDAQRLFDRIVGSIARVADSELACSVNFTLTRPQLEDLESAYGLAVDELGADGFVAIKFFAGGYGRNHLNELEIPFPVWSRFFAGLTRKKLDGQMSALRISVAAPWEFYTPIIEHGIDVASAEAAWSYRSPLREPTYARLTAFGDPGGLVTLAVSAEGSVYPSVLLDHAVDTYCGNVRLDTLDAIWQESPMLRRLRQPTSSALMPPVCRECPLWTVCGGGSRARPILGGRGLYGVDSLCPIASGSADASP